MLNDFPSEEKAILDFLNKHTTRRPGELVGILFGGFLGHALRYIETTPFQCLEDIPVMFTNFGLSPEVAADEAKELVEWAYDTLLERYEGKVDQKLDRFRNKGANRANYVNEPVFTWYEQRTPEGEGTGMWRWFFERKLRSFGLLAQLINHKHGFQKEPVAMAVLAEPPANPRDEDYEARTHTAMTAMLDHGIAISGRRLAWNTNSPGWAILCRTFPNVIDMSAYCHGLNAPVLPEGFLPEVTVSFAKLMTPSGTDLETDGSGIYHQDFEPLKPFIAKYGLVAFQLRVLHPELGLFAKGIVFPSELALNESGNPAILLDWKQIKARHKQTALAYRDQGVIKSYDKCFVGILQAWHKPTKLSGGFELLENIQTTPRTKELVEQLVNKAMDRLDETGIDGLTTEVARKDHVIKLMLQLIHAGQQHPGMEKLHPWYVPRIRKAIQDRLARRLYEVSQGAGIKVPSYVARMDATIPVGKCVLTNRDGSWVPAGTEVVGWRFPIVLPQGLLQLVTCDPPEHTLVDGKATPHTVMLSGGDAYAAQADDDGDIFGFTTDVILIELFTHKLDQDLYAIEPKGKPKLGKDGKPLASNSSEGLLYLMDDHRGPVGRCTVWRSRLLAVGDLEAARAISVAIQECIDQNKRIPEWTDVREAANPRNWTLVNGVWKCTIRFKPEEVPNGEFPMELISDWVKARLVAAGCIELNDDNEVQAKDPLWWRKPTKRIDTTSWYIPQMDERFENLIHYATRVTNYRWMEFAAKFEVPTEGSVPMGALLPLVMTACGIPVRPLSLTNEEYTYLKSKAGIQTYNSKMASILNKMASEGPDSEESFKEKQRSLFTAQQQFEDHVREAMRSGDLTNDEIVTIWMQECDEERGGKVNNAFRLVCWDGSPVLEALGIHRPSKCQFLLRGKENRTEWLVDTARASSDPFQKLRDVIMASRRHQDGYVNANGEVTEEPVLSESGVPVPFHACPDCMQEVQDKLVRSLRNSKDSREQEFLRDLNRSVNAALKIRL